MPEGDTIFRVARTLEKVLGGKNITAFWSPLPELSESELVGQRIERVEPRGKNLLVHLDDGRALYTHMRMTGSWHVYRPGETWQKPERQAKAVIETADMVAVCFNAPIVELLSASELKRHPVLRRLGPDLLAGEFDYEEASCRLRERNDLPIGVALMAQSAIAGIGNVYKSETMFLCQLNPFVAVKDISDQDLKRLLAKARELMKANLQGFPR